MVKGHLFMGIFNSPHAGNPFVTFQNSHQPAHYMLRKWLKIFGITFA